MQRVRRKDFSETDLRCAKCGAVIARKTYQNQILELSDGLKIFNWVRGECGKILATGRPCGAVFEWIAPILEPVASDLSPDILRDVLSAARAQKTAKKRRIKTREIVT